MVVVIRRGCSHDSWRVQFGNSPTEQVGFRFAWSVSSRGTISSLSACSLLKRLVPTKIGLPNTPVSVTHRLLLVDPVPCSVAPLAIFFTPSSVARVGRFSAPVLAIVSAGFELSRVDPLSSGFQYPLGDRLCLWRLARRRSRASNDSVGCVGTASCFSPAGLETDDPE